MGKFVNDSDGGSCSLWPFRLGGDQWGLKSSWWWFSFNVFLKDFWDGLVCLVSFRVEQIDTLHEINDLKMGWIGFKFWFSRSLTRLVGKWQPLCPLFSIVQWGYRLSMLCPKWFGSNHFIQVSELSIFWNYVSWMSLFPKSDILPNLQLFWISCWSLGFYSILNFHLQTVNLCKLNWLTKTIFAILLLFEEYCTWDINNIKQYK